MHNALKLKLLIAELFPEGSLRRKNSVSAIPLARARVRLGSCGNLRSIYRRFPSPGRKPKTKNYNPGALR